MHQRILVKKGRREIRRVTVNLPKQLVEQAQQTTHTSLTDTLIEGLQLVQQRGAYAKGMALKGKIDLKINLAESRERAPR